MMYTTRQAAEYLTLSRETLRTWRYRGVGPRYHRFGRAIRYSKQDLDDWINARAFASTAQYETPATRPCSD